MMFWRMQKKQHTVRSLKGNGRFEKNRAVATMSFVATASVRFAVHVSGPSLVIDVPDFDGQPGSAVGEQVLSKRFAAGISS
jgi:hypothetical protein